ncbi:hypothetical protein BH10PSE19_BH10PSE19_00410 [soil metagenome]
MLAHYRQREKQQNAKVGAFRGALQFGLNFVYTIFTAMSAQSSLGYLFKEMWFRNSLISMAAFGDIAGMGAALSAWWNASNRHFGLWRDLVIETLKIGLVIASICLPLVKPLFAIAFIITLTQQVFSLGSTYIKIRRLRREGAHEKNENDPAYKEYQATMGQLFFHGKLIIILGLTLASIILSAGIFGVVAPAAVTFGVCIATAAVIGLDVGHSMQGSIWKRIILGSIFTAFAVLSTTLLPEFALAVGLTMSTMPIFLGIVVGLAMLIFTYIAINDYLDTKVELIDEVEMVVVRPNPNVGSEPTAQPSPVSSPQQSEVEMAVVRPNPNAPSALDIQDSPAKTVIMALKEGRKEDTKRYLLAELVTKSNALVEQFHKIHAPVVGTSHTLSAEAQSWKDKIKVLERSITFVNKPQSYKDKAKNASIFAKAPRAFDGFTTPEGCETERLVAAAEIYAKHCITPPTRVTAPVVSSSTITTAAPAA